VLPAASASTERASSVVTASTIIPGTRRRVLDLVPEAELRTADGPPLVTDEGHHLLDCRLPAEGDLRELAAALKATVGVVEHGLFLGMADEVLLGHPDGRVEVLRRAAAG